MTSLVLSVNGPLNNGPLNASGSGSGTPREFYSLACYQASRAAYAKPKGASAVALADAKSALDGASKALAAAARRPAAALADAEDAQKAALATAVEALTDAETVAAEAGDALRTAKTTTEPKLTAAADHFRDALRELTGAKNGSGIISDALVKAVTAAAQAFAHASLKVTAAEAAFEPAKLQSVITTAKGDMTLTTAADRGAQLLTTLIADTALTQASAEANALLTANTDAKTKLADAKTELADAVTKLADAETGLTGLIHGKRKAIRDAQRKRREALNKAWLALGLEEVTNAIDTALASVAKTGFFGAEAETWETKAVANLELADVDPKLKLWRAEDPQLAVLRGTGPYRKEFGRDPYPDTDFLKIPKIKPHRAGLKRLGVTTPQTLAYYTRRSLMQGLGLSGESSSELVAVAALATSVPIYLAAWRVDITRALIDLGVTAVPVGQAAAEELAPKLFKSLDEQVLKESPTVEQLQTWLTGRRK